MRLTSERDEAIQPSENFQEWAKYQLSLSEVETKMQNDAMMNYRHSEDYVSATLEENPEMSLSQGERDIRLKAISISIFQTEFWVFETLREARRTRIMVNWILALAACLTAMQITQLVFSLK